jgi:hypothetical protein
VQLCISIVCYKMLAVSVVSPCRYYEGLVEYMWVVELLMSWNQWDYSVASDDGVHWEAFAGILS